MSAPAQVRSGAGAQTGRFSTLQRIVALFGWFFDAVTGIFRGPGSAVAPRGKDLVGALLGYATTGVAFSWLVSSSMWANGVWMAAAAVFGFLLVRAWGWRAPAASQQQAAQQTRAKAPLLRVVLVLAVLGAIAATVVTYLRGAWTFEDAKALGSGSSNYVWAEFQRIQIDYGSAWWYSKPFVAWCGIAWLGSLGFMSLLGSESAKRTGLTVCLVAVAWLVAERAELKFPAIPWPQAVQQSTSETAQ